MSNKIKLLNVRELSTDEKIQGNKDYAIVLIASRISEEIPDTFDDKKQEEIIYRLKVSEIQAVYDLKTKTPVDFTHGKTPSQKYRFMIQKNLGDDEYDNFMAWRMSKVDEDCDNYRENLTK